MSAMHACTKCGKVKPVAEFGKWRRSDKRAAWYCDSCEAGRSTPLVRRYRSDPVKRERDREASRRWKREHLGQPGLPKS